MIGQHDDRLYHRRRWERSERSETTSASRIEYPNRCDWRCSHDRKSCAHNQARQPSNPFSCAAPSYVPPSRFPPLEVCVRRPRCARRATVMGPASANLHRSGRSSNANWDQIQREGPIIGCKASSFLKSLSGNLADFSLQKGTQFGWVPRVSVGRCRCFPQDFYKRFSGMIKRKLHLLFCKQRRRKHETHDNSISRCVRALQYVRACKNGPA
jgi:hypothetical protein